MGSGQPLPDSVPAALPRGSSIGRYIVLAMVGRGGMGEVYAAYDPELDRKVAVKLLRVKPGNGVTLSEGRQRTLREAQAIARLSHPNVVVAYDVGTFEDKVFIAMEYVEGNTVTVWLQMQPRSWREILRVFMDAGRGLAAAHEKGLVHRDFKTDNVMVSRDRHVRVMDFGLARQVQDKPGAVAGAVPAPGVVPSPAPANTTGSAQAATTPKPIPIRVFEPGPSLDGPPEAPTIVITRAPTAPVPIDGQQQRSSSGMFDARLTRTGAMMGTPAYMAPEQFLGTPTDTRSDQFSFCISLYEALYGERPFEGSTMSTLTANVVQGNVRDAPAGSKVPIWVRKVLLRGLQPRARDRWASMEAMIEAFEKDPNIKRRKLAAGAGGVFVIGLLALGGRQLLVDKSQICSGGPPKLAGIWDLQKPGEPEPARHTQIRTAFMQTGKSYAPDVFVTVSRALTTYARNWANMYRDACEATQVRGEQSAEVLDLRMTCLQERLGGVRALTAVFAEANGEVVENAVNATNALESLDRCANVPLLRAVVRPPEDQATRARVAELRNRSAELKARFDSGRWKDALRDATPLVAAAREVGYSPLVAESLLLLGTIALKSEDTPNAEAALRGAYIAAEASRHDEVRAEAATGLVWVVGFQDGRVSEAKRWAEIAEAILRRLGGHTLLQSWLLNDLGALYARTGEKDAMLRAEREALSLKRGTLGADHPDVGISEGNIAFALQEAGQSQEALVHIGRALAILEKGLGAGHPDVATQFSNRGEILNALGRHREALESFEKARSIWERELGSDDRNMGYALTGLGVAHLAEGNPVKSLVYLQRAFKIREALETNPSRRAETRFALARALWDSKRSPSEATQLAQEAKHEYETAAEKLRVAEVSFWLREHSSR